METQTAAQADETRLVSATVTNILHTGTAFARILDEEEDVFISAGAAHKARLCVGDIVEARVVPNRQPGSARWFAYFVHRETSTDPSAIDAAVKAALADGPLSTRQLHEEIDIEIDIRDLETRLSNMFRDGLIARAGGKQDPYGREDIVVWALDVQDFEPVYD
jgi:transcription termination factor Rho